MLRNFCCFCCFFLNGHDRKVKLHLSVDKKKFTIITKFRAVLQRRHKRINIETNKKEARKGDGYGKNYVKVETFQE